MHTGGSPGPPLSQRPFGSGRKAGSRDLSCALGSFVTSGSLVIVLILSASIATASSSTPRASLAVAPPSETATTSHSHQSLPRGQMRHLPTTAACWIMAHRHALGAQAATRQAPKLCTIVFPGLVAALPLREIHSPDSLLHHGTTLLFKLFPSSVPPLSPLHLHLHPSLSLSPSLSPSPSLSLSLHSPAAELVG